MQIANMKITLRNAAFVLVILTAVTLLTRNFSGQAVPPTTAPARHYYLTKAAFNGNQALTACSQGYHFASFAELFDPSVMTYNQSLGRSQADDGSGPPIGVVGWVRTGYISNSNPNLNGGANYPTNCNVWTSGATSDDGEGGVYAPTNGTTNPGPVFNVGDNFACDDSQGYSMGVWCVQN